MKNLQEFANLKQEEKIEVLTEVAKKANQDQLKVWEDSTNQIATNFAKKYYDTDEFYWVADDIGGVLHIADDFFDLNDIVDYLRYEYPVDKMFEHHHYAYDMWKNEKEDSIICIRDYIKIK